MGTSGWGSRTQLQDIDRGFEIVAAFPELKGKPIVIGESDPDGCAACPATVFPQNGYRNGTLYASYTAAAFARKIDLADKHGVNFEGALTWAFEFEDQPYFAGFRVLATQRHRSAGAERVPHVRPDGRPTAGRGKHGRRRPGSHPAQGVREAPEVMPWPAWGTASLSVLVWHYHDDDLPGRRRRGRAERLQLAGRRRPRSGGALPHRRGPQQRFRGLEAHGLSAAADARAARSAEAVGRLKMLALTRVARTEAGKLELKFPLPRQAVSLVTLRW